MGNLIDIPDVNPRAIVVEDKPSFSKSTFDAKNYLNVRLGPKEKTKTLTIRLLPMDLTTGDPFVVLYSHRVPVPTSVSENGFKTYFCLKKSGDVIDHETYGHKCPFCEINHTAYEEAQKAKKEGKEQEAKNWTKVSTANIPRQTVICRCIERGKENEGVKFWKFNIREQDLSDPYNQIMDLYNLRKEEGARAGKDVNILSIYNGRDLNIKITDGNSAPVVTDAGFETPLSNDQSQMEAWVLDSKKWQDVFVIKPYEYLYLISQNLVPYFDSEKKVWVDRDVYDKEHGIVRKGSKEAKEADDAVSNAENRLKEEASAPQITTAPVKQDFMASITIPDVQAPADEDDDLPF